MRKLTLGFRWLIALAAIAFASRPATAHEVPAPVALINGRIVTADGGTVIEKGTVLIQDEKIAAVGTDVKVPDGVRTIDVSGMTVCPGLIDVRSTLWVIPDSVTASASDGSLNFADALDTYSEDWIEVAKQGITTVCVQPNGTMGGRAVVVRVAPAEDAEHLIIEGTSAIQASLGSASSAGTSVDRYKRYEALKKSLDAVKKYQDEWKKYREALKKWEEEQNNPKKKSDAKDAAKGDKKEEKKSEEEKKPAQQPVVRIRGRIVPPEVLERMRARGIRIPGMPQASQSKPAETAKGKDGKPKEPKRDKVKDVLIGLLEGKFPLRIEVHRADEAAHALKLAADFKIKVVLEGLSDVGRSWDEVHKERPPLIAGPLMDFETVPRRPRDWFHGVAESEGLVAIATFARNPRGSRLLRVHAAAAVAEGLSSHRALESITIQAARVLGIADKRGSITKGKIADVAVFAGDPTNPAAAAVLTISQGAITYDAQTKPAAIDSSRTEITGMPPELPDHYALKSSRVLHEDGKFAPATVLVQGGRIVSVGDTDAEVTTFDLGDAVVTPGLVVAHAPGSTASSVDPVAAHLHAAWNYNPDSTGLNRMTRAGFTAVGYAPVSTNVVAGQMTCIRHDTDQPVAMKDGSPLTVASKLVMSSSSRNAARFPSALSGQVNLLDRYFSGEDLTTRLYVPGSIEAAMDQRAAAILDAMKSGALRAVFEAETDNEIRAALDMMEKYKLKGVLLHPREIAASADRIRRMGVGIVARTVQVGDYDWYAEDLAAASQAGTPIGFSATTPEQIRATAALLVNAGMSPEAAARSLTSDAAGVCGLPNVGRIASGAPADLVVWTGLPLDPGARAAHVILDGRVREESK